ncbi:hypothetical protein Q1W71_01265 [Flavobacterium pectinovorum]|uniref:hypothetical protein n=1 Tax=Flavobacterium pectinovorum TaxID=29533 RepID=UPI00265EC7B5|nr:hypothetical protein [Flavobacterium pectinovorum]WKL48412.1 hypothetical protein Q1W71_01265 [Flavobacterium pectinovorum]
MSAKEISTADGKLFFSNPPHPDSAFQPELKNLNEVKVFKIDTTAATASRSAAPLPQVAVYTVAVDVVVTPTNPLIISGSGPVQVSYNKVTIQPGGQIKVLTTADIRIAELVKM